MIFCKLKLKFVNINNINKKKFNYKKKYIIDFNNFFYCLIVYINIMCFLMILDKIYLIKCFILFMIFKNK